MAHPPPPPRTTGMSSYVNGDCLSLVKDNARRLNLKGATLQVMEEIALHANKENISYPSQERMERRLNSCRRTIIRAVAELERRGLISKLVRGRGPNHCNRYQIVRSKIDPAHTSSGLEKVTLTPEKVTLTPEKVTSCSPEYTEDTLNNSPIVPKGDKSQENENSDFNHPLLSRFLKLFQIPENRPLASKTRRAWKANRRLAESLNEDEWRLLEWRYAQTEGEVAKFRRQSPRALLENLQEEITRARSWRDRIEVERPAPRPAPEGWAEMILAEYPDSSLTTWERLCDSMKAWVWEKVRERASLPLHHAFVADLAME